MAVDSDIQQRAEEIRNADYGWDITETIAKGLESMSEVIVNNTNRQGDVETQFQQVIEETTDKDIVSAPEIIAARNGESNLKERLDKENQSVTAQLADIVTVNVKSFGAKGDGVTDDSTAIQNAIAALPKNGSKLLFPAGVYIHGDGTTTGYSYEKNTSTGGAIEDASHPVDIGRDIRFIFKDFNNLTVSGYGASVQSHDNNGECRNNSIFTFENCTNLRIEGIKIDARSLFREPILNDYNTGLGYADRHSLSVRYGETVTLQDVESNYSMMDGFTISGDATKHPKNVRIINCSAFYNYRQGLTISSVKDCLVDGGNYSFTGVLRGTLPMSGIDIEADSYKNYNVTVKNATVDSNKVSGIIFSYRSSNCKVEKCTFTGKGISSVYDNTCENNEVTGNTFINCGIGLSQYGLKVTDNLFLVSTITGYIFDFTTYTNSIDGKVDIIENNIVKCDLTNITGSSGYIGGVRLKGSRKMKFRNNTLKNVCSLENTNAISFGDGASVQDNQILFDYDGVNVTSNTAIISMFAGDVKNNVIKGYPSANVQGYKYYNPFGASSNHRISKTFSVYDKINSLYKIKSSYTGTLRVYNFSGEFVEYTVRFNLSTGAFTCTYSSRLGSTTFCNVYKNGTNVYVEPLENHIVVSVDYVSASALTYVSPLDVTMDLDTTTEKSTLTLITVG